MPSSEVDVHKRNQAGNQGPLCKQVPWTEDVIMADNIDLLTCVFCLRLLAKDAVIYGNQRRPSRKW